jgi:hypothetical protein
MASHPFALDFQSAGFARHRSRTLHLPSHRLVVEELLSANDFASGINRLTPKSSLPIFDS